MARSRLFIPIFAATTFDIITSHPKQLMQLFSFILGIVRSLRFSDEDQGVVSARSPELSEHGILTMSDRETYILSVFPRN